MRWHHAARQTSPLLECILEVLVLEGTSMIEHAPRTHSMSSGGVEVLNSQGFLFLSAVNDLPVVFANCIANVWGCSHVFLKTALQNVKTSFLMREGPVLFMAQMKPAWLSQSMGTWVPAPLRMSRSCSFIPCTFTEHIHRSQYVQPQCPLRDVSTTEARTF